MYITQMYSHMLSVGTMHYYYWANLHIPVLLASCRTNGQTDTLLPVTSLWKVSFLVMIAWQKNIITQSLISQFTLHCWLWIQSFVVSKLIKSIVLIIIFFSQAPKYKWLQCTLKRNVIMVITKSHRLNHTAFWFSQFLSLAGALSWSYRSSCQTDAFPWQTIAKGQSERK